MSKPLINWLNSERSARKYALSDYERICYELKPCDVVLIEGRTRVSDVIGWITQSPWTHAALYIGRIHDIEDEELSEIIRNHYDGEAGDRLVIESILGRGTLVQNLQTYETEHMRICRPSRLSLKDSKQVRRYAISRLGVDYDVRQIFDLARFLFPWFVLPRKWRSTLFKSNSGQSARTVCSTMIAEAFAYVQFPILPLVKQSEEESVQLFRRNPKLCTPSDFDYSPYFEIIKYPFVDFRHDQDYHMLPWNGSTELSDEENQLYVDPETKPDPREVEESILEAVEKSRSVPLEGEWIPADETREDP
ncbi:MAG: hypothetical protein CMQ20_02240 [Gammaproteobacteria bacterium]|nr:hypothetical protein [Gammaproteobacteria bacterium]